MATVRQIETSMSKKYKGTPKVSQTTIDNIKKMGMTASLKKAASSKNPEYLEGIKRMYGANRLAAAKKATASSATNRKSPRVAERASSVTNRKSPRVAERASATAGRTSPRVAERKVSKAAATKKSSKTTDPFAKFILGIPSAYGLKSK
jgi:hypothetical protein